jgi:S1/P1 Nuclease
LKPSSGWIIIRNEQRMFMHQTVRSKTIVATLVTAVMLLASATPAWSWGRDGHRVVARIAAKNLSQEARMKIAAILQTNAAGVEEAMARASTWPDEIDKVQTGSREWHFIDGPVTALFSVAGLCPQHNCVIDQIENLQSRLRNNTTGFTLLTPPSPPRPMTSQELAFLIHFVGDIHQPLHAATNGDRGGNCVELANPLLHPDGSQTTDLHAVWDVDEVLRVFGALGKESATAAALFQRFKNGAAVQQVTVQDWARESNALARTSVYQKLQVPNHTAPPGVCAPGIAKITVTQSYLNGNVADVERRLMQAGIRLSNLLNQICAGAGCLANPGGGRGRGDNLSDRLPGADSRYRSR